MSSNTETIAGTSGIQEPTTAPAAPRRSGGEFLRLLGVAAVPTIVYFVVVLRNMTYAWDDFIEFGVTTQYGIGRRLLTYNLFEHFAPANRLVHGLLLTWGGLDPRWAIALAVPIFFVYCLALTDLARVLGAGWARTALALAVATVTPATVFVGAFFDPFVHVMVPLAALAVATAAYVRWARTRRLLHALTASLACLIACLVQERGVFIVLVLVLARLLVVDGGVRPRRWVTTLLRDWPFLLAPGLIAVGTAAVVALRYASDAPRGGVLETASFVAQAWGLRFVPMVSGTYGLGSGTLHAVLVVAANVLVAVLLVETVRRNRANARPWLLLLGWFAFIMAFVGFGRLGLGPAATYRDDPNYYAYALPVVVILVATLRPMASAGHRPLARRLLPAGALQLAVAAVLGVLVVMSTLPVAERPGHLAPDYLANSVADLHAANDATPAVVAPTQVPRGLVPAQFFPFNSGELFLREADPRTAVDLDPDDPRFLDTAGHLTTGSAQLLARLEPGAGGANFSATGATSGLDGGSFCLSSGGDGHVAAPLRAPVETPGGAAWIRVIAHGEDAEGAPAAWDGDRSWGLGSPAPLTSPRGSVAFMVPTPRVAQVDIVDIRSSRLCIDAIEVWTLTAGEGSGCSWVGPHGELVPPARTGPRPRCR